MRQPHFSDTGSCLSFSVQRCMHHVFGSKVHPHHEVQESLGPNAVVLCHRRGFLFTTMAKVWVSKLDQWWTKDSSAGGILRSIETGAGVATGPWLEISRTIARHRPVTPTYLRKFFSLDQSPKAITVLSETPNLVYRRAPDTPALWAVISAAFFSVRPKCLAATLKLQPNALAVTGLPRAVHTRKVDGVCAIKLK